MKTNFLRNLLLVAACVIAMNRCGDRSTSAPMAIIDGFAQGTTYHIVIDGCENATDIKVGMDSLLDNISRSMSLYDKASLINAINSNQTDSVDRYISECVAAAHKISVESSGNYDITIKPLVAARGFLADSAQMDINIDSLLQYVGYQKISIENGRIIKANPNMQIDLNSIAQGFSADILAEYLEFLGHNNFLVEIGGEIMVKGQKSDGSNWRVGIDRPTEGNVLPGAELQVKLALPSGVGLATSGNYRKFYYDNNGNKVVHTISPLTGQSVISDLLSATVVAENATLADAYGTMLMVLGLEQSKVFLDEHPEIDAYLVYGTKEGGIDVYATHNMQGYIID